MNKSYISPTKLAVLALVCMVTTLKSGFDALILCVIAGASFVLAISIVSNLEKVTTNHVRFIIYAIIVSAIFTVLKIVFGYVLSLELIEVAEKLDWALLACITLSIMPIYFMHKDSTVAYYSKTILTALIFVVVGVVLSCIIELMTHGTVFGLFIVESHVSMLSVPFLLFIMLAVVVVIGTSIENHVAEKKRAERLLIDKYKVMIREHQLRKLKNQEINKPSDDEKPNNEVGCNN